MLRVNRAREGGENNERGKEEKEKEKKGEESRNVGGRPRINRREEREREGEKGREEERREDEARILWRKSLRLRRTAGAPRAGGLNFPSFTPPSLFITALSFV